MPARIVKMADAASNLRSIAVSPPAGWPAERKLEYLEDCRQLVDAGRTIEDIDVDKLCEIIAQTSRPQLCSPPKLFTMTPAADPPC